MVRGASTGPAPAAQARASSSRLTRSSWRTWPHRKLRRKVPRVDGALTTQPRAPAVPPVRNTSTSSMQSPPASAGATRVIILSPVFARPGASPRSTWLSTSSRRPRCWARVTGRISPALLTRRWSSKAMWMPCNCSDLRGSEQLAAGGEGVQASCAPGAEDGCQRHLALGTTFRPGAPADLAADNHMAQAALGGVVVRRHVRFGHEDEEFLDVALNAPAQPALQS